MMRTVYLRPKSEDMILFDVSKYELLKLVKPLYGLCNSGDYWNVTIDNHLINSLKMERAISDTSMLFMFDRKKLCGITGNYVDDNLHAGTKLFEQKIRAKS